MGFLLLSSKRAKGIPFVSVVYFNKHKNKTNITFMQMRGGKKTKRRNFDAKNTEKKLLVKKESS